MQETNEVIAESKMQGVHIDCSKDAEGLQILLILTVLNITILHLRDLI